MPAPLHHRPEDQSTTEKGLHPDWQCRNDADTDKAEWVESNDRRLTACLSWTISVARRTQTASTVWAGKPKWNTCSMRSPTANVVHQGMDEAGGVRYRFMPVEHKLALTTRVTFAIDYTADERQEDAALLLDMRIVICLLLEDARINC